MPKLSSGTTAQRAWRLCELAGLLDEVAGFPSVAARLRNGQSVTVDGAWGSSRALLAAALAGHVPSCLLVVAATVSDVDSVRDDLATFCHLPIETFPAWESLPADQLAADETYGQRLRLLQALGSPSPPPIIVASIQALLQPVPGRRTLDRSSRSIEVGGQIPMEELLGWLVDQGYQRRETVELPGELSVRGGIVDLFPPDQTQPVRIEYFGDQIESVRCFDPESQRSRRQLQSLNIVAAQGRLGMAAASRSHLCEYLAAGSWVMLIEPDELREHGRQYLQRLGQRGGPFSVDRTFKLLQRFPVAYVHSIGGGPAARAWNLQTRSVERFSGELTSVKKELDQAAAAGDQVIIACHNDAERRRLREVLAECQVAREGRLHLDLGQVSQGFRLALGLNRCPVPVVGQSAGASESWGLIVIGDHELFQRRGLRPPARRRYESRPIESFLDLRPGNYVVHVSHGIGIYRGLESLERMGYVEEHLVVEFRDGVRVYVPASKIELVQKYVGGSRAVPTLSKVGSSAWERRKARVARAVFDLASELIEMQAVRASRPGIAFPDDSPWQCDFEASFPYVETDDQLRTMAEIKRDMCSLRPMDRLVCGDVGYGKTELAMRAAFKAMEFGKQVAVLVPTTVLAEQHYRTFTERMAEFPFVIEVLSRFKTKAQQRETLQRLAAGQIDTIIGTHRLIQPDVIFHDLGLVIIDEEQRFGVEHKERLKGLRRTVDVLTLTATPIPRTLHMSLLGIRDISNLETPPQDRLAIETRISRFDPDLVREAVLRELNRNGQVYFVHNRVQTIYAVAERLRKIVPEARIVVGHGQMPEHELEQAMLTFLDRRADMLVATTIIESGLDIPSVNTIFIDQANQYGLADLHQLRGRVGRYKHRAYAYLLLDPARPITPNARRRLKAIEEYSELGAGFKIALRDLEIRGAGNILGPEQSGHIASVGYEMYCQLLENAVRTLKRQPLRARPDVTVWLPGRCLLPPSYISALSQKMEIYRRLSRMRTLDEISDLRSELVDRFGPLPEEADNLLVLAELRIMAQQRGIDLIRLDGNYLMFSARRADSLKRLARSARQPLRLAEDTSAYLPIANPRMSVRELAERVKAVLQ